MGARFEGKVVLVTGGGAGIGRVTALAFAREKAKVVAADKVPRSGEETVRQIKKEGGVGRFIEADVSKASEVQAMVEKTVETFGRLDCTFNNAGMEGTPCSIVDLTEEAWDQTININLKAVWLCMKYEIPQMLKQSRGAIVNTASIGGLIGARNLVAYIAAKHGVLGMTKTATLEYAEAGLRINAVCPGPVRTGMAERFISEDPEWEKRVTSKNPIARLADPEEIAAAVLWLCSDESSFVTRQAIVLDGGRISG